jgi:hypothetical protein
MVVQPLPPNRWCQRVILLVPSTEFGPLAAIRGRSGQEKLRVDRTQCIILSFPWTNGSVYLSGRVLRGGASHVTPLTLVWKTAALQSELTCGKTLFQGSGVG